MRSCRSSSRCSGSLRGRGCADRYSLDRYKRRTTYPHNWCARKRPPCWMPGSADRSPPGRARRERRPSLAKGRFPKREELFSWPLLIFRRIHSSVLTGDSQGMRAKHSHPTIGFSVRRPPPARSAGVLIRRSSRPGGHCSAWDSRK